MLWSVLQAARHADRAMLERDGLIQKIENGVVRCHELHAQLTEGKEFYSSVYKRCVLTAGWLTVPRMSGYLIARYTVC